MIYDSTSPDVQQFNADLAKRQPITRPPAGFGESFMQELGQFWRENLSISRNLAMDSAGYDRAQRIREIAGDEAFIKALTLPGDPKTQAMIQGLADENPGVIKSDAELLDDIKQRNAELRAEHDLALAHQTPMGKVGGFLGTMAGASTDPVNIGLMAAGVPESRALPWAISTLREMAIQAGLSMAAETAIQGPVLRYKKELESPYSLGDALTSVAGAGVGAAGLTAVVKAGARVFQGIRGARRIDGYDDLLEAASRIENPTSEQRAAMEILQSHADALRQSPFDGAHPQLDDAHLGALQKASDDLANGRPVDVSQFIEQPKIENPPRIIDDAVELDAVASRQKAEQILKQQDYPLTVETGAVDPISGEPVKVQRSARELLREMDQDAKAANIIRQCLSGGEE